ncbi:MAG: 30S ribosome-binding factor RbfA [Planctomycetota bacterium]
MSWNRVHRVEALLQEKIAVLVLERLNDPRLGFVTITGVELSGDRRVATVKFTVLGTPAQRRTTDRALQDASSHIRDLLGPSMNLRILPELRFTYDESIERESQMLSLLEELEAKRLAEEAAAAAGREPGGAADGAADGAPALESGADSGGESGAEPGAVQDSAPGPDSSRSRDPSQRQE